MKYLSNIIWIFPAITIQPALWNLCIWCPTLGVLLGLATAVICLKLRDQKRELDRQREAMERRWQAMIEQMNRPSPRRNRLEEEFFNRKINKSVGKPSQTQ